MMLRCHCSAEAGREAVKTGVGSDCLDQACLRILILSAGGPSAFLRIVILSAGGRFCRRSRTDLRFPCVAMPPAFEEPSLTQRDGRAWPSAAFHPKCQVLNAGY